MNTKRIFAILIVLVLSFSLTGQSQAVTGAGVYAWLLPGAGNTDKTCAYLDDFFADPGTTWIEFKIDSEDLGDGTFVIPGTDFEITISNFSSTSFDFDSTLPIDSVVVKDGVDGAFFYVFDGWSSEADGNQFGEGGFWRDIESLGDTNLTTPTPNPKAISHISFCYDLELMVEKDAVTTFTRTWEWEIEKSVTPEEWDLFTGDSGTSKYIVDVTKIGYEDSDWAVTGTITIFNPAAIAATITDVSDEISGGFVADVDCGGIEFPYELGAGETLYCTYSADLPDAETRLNTATVTTTGEVGGGTATADVIFSDPTTVIGDQVWVSDTNVGSFDPQYVSDTTQFIYYLAFECDDDEGLHENTAELRYDEEDEDPFAWDDASVDVTCWALEVTKDAETFIARTWEWEIDKEADYSELFLAPGQLFDVTYSVTVDADFSDIFWVEGTIWVDNPTPLDAVINEVSDIIFDGIVADVDCGEAEFPYLLEAGETLTCTYSAALPDDETRLNTATATLQNYAYDHEGVGQEAGTTDFSGTAEIDFAEAEWTIVDECIDVEDDFYGPLGQVCVPPDELPYTFTFVVTFGNHEDADIYLECGENTHTNIASFETNDTGATGEDTWTVDAYVDCLEGCTLTVGYWKTHSKYGPAPYDDTWALIEPDGEDTIFYLSGKSYYEVLWTNPGGGNAYYILAHQYIAALLNHLNGAASTPEVDEAMAWADDFFNTYLPTDVLPKAVRQQALQYAELLDDYNNGLIGPGHCEESEEDLASAELYNIDALPIDAKVFLPVVLGR